MKHESTTTAKAKRETHNVIGTSALTGDRLQFFVPCILIVDFRHTTMRSTTVLNGGIKLNLGFFGMASAVTTGNVTRDGISVAK